MQNKKNLLSKQEEKDIIPDELESSNIYGISEQYHSNSNLMNDNTGMSFDEYYYENPKECLPGVDISNAKTYENSKSGIDLNDEKIKENSQKAITEKDSIIFFSNEDSKEIPSNLNQENYDLFRKDCTFTKKLIQDNYSPLTQFFNNEIPSVISQNNLLNKKRDRESYYINNNELEKDVLISYKRFIEYEDEDFICSNLFNKESEDDVCKYFNNIDISSINQKEKEIVLTNSYLSKPIELYVYNFDYFKKNVDQISTSSSQIPEYISIEKIIPYIEKIISKENGIFDGKEDFYRCIEKGVIFNNIRNILENKEGNHLDKGERPLQVAKKYKTFIIGQMYDLINNSQEMKNMGKIKKIKKKKINDQANSGFNLDLFPRPIYSILSNDLCKEEKKKNNYDIIKNIIDDYNNNKEEETPIIKNLCLTYEECLNIILYKNEDPEKRFKYKLEELIKKINDQLNRQKYDMETKKDYIAGFILLGYNLKNFYNGMKKRAPRNSKLKLRYKKDNHIH